MKKFFKQYWMTIVIFLTIFLYYKHLTDNGYIDTFLFPTISDIAGNFQKYLPRLFINMLSSFQLLFPALFIGVAVALAIGIPLGLRMSLRKAIHPIVYSASVIPSILLSPFAIHIAPTFRSAALFLIFYNTIWAILFATINGISAIDRGYLDNAQTLELGPFRKMSKVILPAAMPSIAAGFITSMRSSFLVLSYAEMLGSKHGMGYFIQHHANLGLFTNVWVGFIFMVLVLVTLMIVVEKITSYFLRWVI